MKAALSIFSIWALASCYAQDQGNLIPVQDKVAQQAQRDCSFPAGGWTKVDCSNSAAAASGALTPWSRYTVQCGVDSYLAWGGSGVTADTSDGYLPAGAWLPFMTDSDNIYFSCLNIGSDSDCRYIECK